jgi:hypothetical protein
MANVHWDESSQLPSSSVLEHVFRQLPSPSALEHRIKPALGEPRVTVDR